MIHQDDFSRITNEDLRLLHFVNLGGNIINGKYHNIEEFQSLDSFKEFMKTDVGQKQSLQLQKEISDNLGMQGELSQDQAFLLFKQAQLLQSCGYMKPNIEIGTDPKTGEITFSLFDYEYGSPQNNESQNNESQNNESQNRLIPKDLPPSIEGEGLDASTFLDDFLERTAEVGKSIGEMLWPISISDDVEIPSLSDDAVTSYSVGSSSIFYGADETIDRKLTDVEQVVAKSLYADIEAALSSGAVDVSDAGVIDEITIVSESLARAASVSGIDSGTISDQVVDSLQNSGDDVSSDFSSLSERLSVMDDDALLAFAEESVSESVSLNLEGSEQATGGMLASPFNLASSVFEGYGFKEAGAEMFYGGEPPVEKTDMKQGLEASTGLA